MIPKFLPAGRKTIFFTLVCALAAVLLLNGCAAPQSRELIGKYPTNVTPYRRGPLLTQITGQPLIRVRIEPKTKKATISASSPIRISPSASPSYNPSLAKYFASPVTITRTTGNFVISAGNGARIVWPAKTLRLTAARSGHLAFDGAHYPRALVLNALYFKHKATDEFNVVNYLALEKYIPGVIAHELYGSWDLAAFEAQAVAARSYAIYRINLSRIKGENYDLTSTASSQVYGGKTTNKTALRAVQTTRGQILFYKNRILPAFFSSTSGGRSQDVTAAMPKVVDIAPLHGRKLDGWGRKSSKYRWGPIYRKTNLLSKRISAWGKKNGNLVSHLLAIRTIKINARSASGRPAQFLILGKHGRNFVLPCEWFRFACDYSASSLPKIKALPSSDCDVSVRGNTVAFTNGRGFGHGVGMSQWGAQGMAQAGYNYKQILNYYYPGAGIKRVY